MAIDQDWIMGAYGPNGGKRLLQAMANENWSDREFRARAIAKASKMDQRLEYISQECRVMTPYSQDSDRK